MKPPETRPLLLTAVESIGDEERVRNVYLHLVRNPDGSEEPIRLGTGRNAVVFLATDIKELGERSDFRAVKFLRDDPDDQLAYSAAVRFFQEALSLQNKSGNLDSLVRFLGWGAVVRDLQRRGPVNSVKEFWWGEMFNGVRSVSFEENNSEDFRRIKARYSLQGPFYCLELCHGTLEHLLERNERWFDLNVYRHNQASCAALVNNARELKRDLELFVRRYLHHPQEQRPLALEELSRSSGYDILNAFKTAPVQISDEQGQPLRDEQGPVRHDPNLIRNHTVLKLFIKIVQSLQYLHGKGEAHRDLKPGNIFFRHTDGLPLRVDVKLADLGYVTNSGIIEGGETLRGGSEQAPGSPFYRAPEQADLPIEVRVTVDSNDPRRVTGKGSKISNIQASDWLFVADLFDESMGYHLDPTTDEDTGQRERRAQRTRDLRSEYRDRRYYRIKVAHLDERSGQFVLELEKEVATRERYDLQAQISKNTGFHTDIYSLGAILYDLASGGRNPEHFYTYCLKVFTNQFGVNDALIPDSIDEILEILAPLNRGQPRELHNRPRLAWMVSTTRNVDALIEEILRSAYVNAAELEVEKKIRDYRFRTFDVVNILLTDKRGAPIPREIIRIIVRCMLRDKVGSFCNSHDGWSAFSSPGRPIVKDLEDEVNALLGGQFRLPDQHFPDRLQDDLLFRLRAISFDPNATAERPAAPERPAASGQPGTAARPAAAITGPLEEGSAPEREVEG